MIIRWFKAGILAATLCGGPAAAELLDVDYRNGGNWRSPPPAWGNTPGAAPYGNFRREAGPYQGYGYGDGAPTYRRDRERWRNNPGDRHERNRQDDWRGPTGRPDDRRGERPHGAIQRRRPPEQAYPPPGYGPYGPYAPPAYGPYAPPGYGPYTPYPGPGGYRPPPRGAYDAYPDRYRDDGYRYDDGYRDDRY